MRATLVGMARERIDLQRLESDLRAGRGGSCAESLETTLCEAGETQVLGAAGMTLGRGAPCALNVSDEHGRPVRLEIWMAKEGAMQRGRLDPPVKREAVHQLERWGAAHDARRRLRGASPARASIAAAACVAGATPAYSSPASRSRYAEA